MSCIPSGNRHNALSSDEPKIMAKARQNIVFFDVLRIFALSEERPPKGNDEPFFGQIRGGLNAGGDFWEIS